MASNTEPLICWVTLAGLAVNICIADGIVRSYGLLYLEFLEMYGAGPLNTGWIATTFSLTSAALAPVAGWLCDHFPVWQSFAGGSLIGCAALWACSLSASLPVTIVTWGLGFGLSDVLVFPASVSATSKIFKHNRSLALGILYAGGSVGAMCLPPISVHLTNMFGPRGTLRIYSGIQLNILISAFLVWSHGRRLPMSARPDNDTQQAVDSKKIASQAPTGNTLNHKPGISIIEVAPVNNLADSGVIKSNQKADDADDTEQTKACRRSTLRQFISLQFICVFLYNFGIYFGVYGFTFYAPAYAEELGLSANHGSLLLTMCGAADLAGRLAIGWLANLQCTNLYLLLISNLLTGAVMLVILSIFPGHIVLAVTMVVLGFFLGGSTPMLGELVVDAVGVKLAGTGIGIASTGFGLGLSLYPLIIGAIRETVGTYANVPHLSAAAFVLAALSLAIGRRCHPCGVTSCRSKSYQVDNTTDSGST